MRVLIMSIKHQLNLPINPFLIVKSWSHHLLTIQQQSLNRNSKTLLRCLILEIILKMMLSLRQVVKMIKQWYPIIMKWYTLNKRIHLIKCSKRVCNSNKLLKYNINNKKLMMIILRQIILRMIIKLKMKKMWKWKNESIKLSLLKLLSNKNYQFHNKSKRNLKMWLKN